MDDIRDRKIALRKQARDRITALTKQETAEKHARIQQQLLEFANFQEAQTVLFYISQGVEFDLSNILAACPQLGKDIVLPLFDPAHENECQLLKVTSLDTDLKTVSGSRTQPDPDRCKPVSFDSIDIAMIPGVAFDEKGGRLGNGTGRYDRLIPMLPNTARKVALALEDQILGAIPAESHDKSVDIIITEKRIIYKI